MLRLLSERASLRAVCYVLMVIRRPEVTGLRVVALVVAAMDHLFRPVLEFNHQMPEPHWAGFEDFLLHFHPPKIPDLPLPVQSPC
jgi:hypothetical protein